MRTALNKLWTALESVPGLATIKAEWRKRLGVEIESAWVFFRPNGKFASFLPCTVQNGCGCDHEVVIHGLDDIVAVCRCGSGCETFRLDRSDTVVYSLDRGALDTAVAGAFGLFREGGSKVELPGTTRVGDYSPYAGFRFPAYLTIQLEPSEMENVVDGLLGRNEAPFILLAPTRDLCRSAMEDRLSRRKCVIVPLSENLVIADNGRFQSLRSIDVVLSAFRSAVLPKTKDDDGMVFFPTPPEAIWGDVTIRFTDGHTVSIRVLHKRGIFNYTQMGMVNKKNGEPTKQWDLLRAFAEERGILDWSSIKADRRNQKRREILASNLGDFFRINGDPIGLTDDGKGWRVRFLLYPES